MEFADYCFFFFFFFFVFVIFLFFFFFFFFFFGCRYDARLLLSEYPEYCRSLSNASSITPSSPSGWSDLPSDTEDAFFLSASEIAELQHTKQQKALEDARSSRLSALRAAGDEEDEDNNGDDGDPWGDSDEEPDEAQRMLMERTATHLRGAENRTLLTARILANHGADKRFAFLRGRWKRAWLRAQAQAIAKAKADAERDKPKVGLMGLNNYADSDEEDPPSSGGEKPPPVLVTNEADSEVSELKKQEMRRARAREWAAKRRLQTQN